MMLYLYNITKKKLWIFYWRLYYNCVHFVCVYIVILTAAIGKYLHIHFVYYDVCAGTSTVY